MMKKRGISPLIATILLIGFTIALIILIILWGRAYVEKLTQKDGALSQEQMKCSTGVEISAKDISGDSITIDNTGMEDIKGFVIRSKKDGDVSNSEIIRTIKSGESDEISLPSGFDEFEIIPALKPYGKGAPLVPCSSKMQVVSIN